MNSTVFMSHEKLYLLTSLACGIVALVPAVILAGMKIRKSEGLEKYDKARWCLVAAFAVFSVLNLLEVSCSGSTGLQTGSLTGSLVIIIGSLLAMFFTMTVLSFIRPSIVNRRQILAQLAAIIPPGVLLIFLRLYASESVYKVYFFVMLAAYILLMALYTRLFVKSYLSFKEQMLAFYEEEDLVAQLQWINVTFWLALATGMVSLLFIAGDFMLSSIVNMVFSVCFLLVCVFFINFRPYAVMVNRAVTGVTPDSEPEDCDGDMSDTGDLEERINGWIRNKGYLDNTKSVEDVADEIGWLYPVLKQYIKQTTGEDFRTWRIRLRIEEARRIMAARPDLPVSHVAAMAGFNDRSYFYRTFQKITGSSVKAFQESLKKD